MAKQIKCPKFKGHNIDLLQNKRKSFSVRKAIGGAILTGRIGTMAGFIGKREKNEWFCRNCGTVLKK